MKIICVGRNYRDHAAELGNEVPDEIVLFLKPESALVDSSQSVMIPSFTKDLHYEVEVVLRVSTRVKEQSVNDYSDVCDALTVGLDFTARDIQTDLKKKGLPWEKAKAFDGSAAVGEFVSVAQGVQRFSLSKNGKQVQFGSTDQMIYGFSTILSAASAYFTLEPGDLVFTGTPAGVGPVQSGDKLEGFLGSRRLFDVRIV
jgi:2-keto-4-pentenoate hydratase/2-oxohepta-3-ene-1,7-dioic acid hydratase in catechol pathway